MSSLKCEEEPFVATEDKGKLFLIMTESGEFQYSLYEIEDPPPNLGNGEDAETIRNFGTPLLSMEKSIYPEDMSFVAIGSKIYMAGGSFCNNNNYCASDKVFIYDIIKSTIISGPSMNSGKDNLYLFTLGTQLFALSHLMYKSDHGSGSATLNCKPTFEMWDTKDIDGKWCNLPMPTLNFSARRNVYSMSALAAVFVGGSGGSRGFIFLSVNDAGTYAFDVNNVTWNYVSDQLLPFSDQAERVPHDPFICCAYSLNSNKFAAFRFAYEVDESNAFFKVDEISVDNPYQVFPILPRLQRCRPSRTVFGPNGRVYFIGSGVVTVGAYDSLDGNRYVKVGALNFSTSKIDLDSICSMEIEQEGDDNLVMGQVLKSCSNVKKRKMVDDRDQDNTLETGINKGLQRCSTLEEEHALKVETKLALKGRWRMCYFGGPICEELIHVAEAFAI